MASRKGGSLIGALVLAAVVWSEAPADTVGPARRAAGQETVLRFYDELQRGTSGPFERRWSAAAISETVERTALMERALGERWGVRVTGEMLRHEAERIARATRFPDRLRELYRRLDDDPLLIQETFLRPLLVERLVRNAYAADPELYRAGVGFKTWWDVEKRSLARRPLETVADSRPLPMPRASSGPTARSAGSCDDDDAWDNASLGLPTGSRHEGVSVWTGARLLVWGGRDTETGVLLSGVSYDPLIDAWSEISTVGQPALRVRPAATWSGAEMVVWGGSVSGVPIAPGGRYDPETDTWSSMSEVGAPPPRARPSVVWTGTLALFWGGDGVSCSESVDGGAYDPALDVWHEIPNAGAPSCRHGHSAVWSGTEMLVWGGEWDSPSFAQDGGGRYDPASQTWSPIDPQGSGGGRSRHVAVWTGNRMLVVGGGTVNQDVLETPLGGRLYDPVTDAWRSISTVDAPSYDTGPAAALVGDEVLVCCDGTGQGARYDPYDDVWTRTARYPPAARGAYWAWTGSELVVGDGAQTARYTPDTDAWLGSGADTARRSHAVSVWTGTHVVVWSGRSASSSTDTGWRYDPLTDTRIGMSLDGAPAPRWEATAVWTGREMIVWGGLVNGDSNGTGGRYDPVSDTWRRTSTVNAPTGGFGSMLSAVWTGSEMLLWNGGGYRYDPLADIWTVTATTDAPRADNGQAMVWTGEAAIVWGGRENGVGAIGGGASYDPASDTWTPLSELGAPTGRSDARAVWTGSEMIVWGGVDGSGVHLDSGGRYDPQSDTWSSTTTLDAPSPREGHAMAWTGSAALVWGGRGPASVPLGDGARYDPVGDAWTPTTAVDAPTPREAFTADWTGEYLVVWGGAVGTTQLADGGRYAATAPDTDGDGWSDGCDDCPNVADADQSDADGDGYGDACDDCPSVPQALQVDTDGDGAGDACDLDDDDDGVSDGADNCPLLVNPAQGDVDADGTGDACDRCPLDAGNDLDQDGLCLAQDNCPGDFNPLQEDLDGDGIGDLCDPCREDSTNDGDGDRLCVPFDNCPTVFNPYQVNLDGDPLGNLCDVCPLATGTRDDDGDGTPDVCDCEPNDPGDRGPPEISMLSLDKGPGGSTLLTWPSVAGADLYPITRGDLGSLGLGAYGSCLGHTVETVFDDTEIPLADSGYSYLVQAENVECGLSGLGFDGHEQPRSNLDASGCGPVAVTDVAAEGELTSDGTVSGSFSDTVVSDDLRETVTEVLSSGGNPANRYSLLDHRWTFHTTPGGRVELHVEGRRSPGAEDDFVFAYSLDGVTFVPVVLEVPPLPTADDDIDRVAVLPGAAATEVTIRVTDTDRTPGNQSLDSVAIDRLWIRVLP